MKKVNDYFQLIRVKHWIKNILVFIPLIFSFKFTMMDSLINTIIGFLSFSFISSTIYIINDISDIDKDRKHPKKKNRPLASGKVSIKESKIIATILFVLSLVLNIFFTVNKISIAIILLYFLLNVLYSKKLKNIPIIDVAILMSGFVLRVFFGSFIIGVPLSSWLYLTIISFSFYLSLGKRRNEFLKNGVNSREVLKYYSKDFLDKNMYVFLALTMVFYSLWATDSINILSQYVKYSIPLVMIIVMRYSLIIEGDSHGDPVDVVLGDKFLIITIILYFILIFSGIILNINLVS